MMVPLSDDALAFAANASASTSTPLFNMTEISMP
jgi:hypothetical protein